ncbi:hypothetical protein JYT15_00370 [Acidimicrobium ferrooxidans]|nr:hypothetical protein [Acidimicrobium ferrooxidans]
MLVLMVEYPVYIIESANEQELADGDRLEGVALHAALDVAEIDVTLMCVKNASELSGALSTVGGEVTARSGGGPVIPIVHLSCHGDDDGVALTEEDLSWDDLRGVMSPLANQLDSSLILGMSSCRGLNARKMVKALRPDYQAPFYILVGPSEAVDWAETLTAFSVFYHLLCYQREPTNAIRAMNLSVAKDNVFEAVYSRLEVQAQEEMVRAEIRRILEEDLKQAFPAVGV